MRKYFKPSIIAACAAVFALFVSAKMTWAQDSGIQISPIDYQFEIKTGESQNGKLTVTNKDKSVLNYSIEMELFSQISEDGAPSFAGTQKTEGVTSLTDWIQITDADKTGQIQASGKKEIEFKITVPAGAEPGGHYAAIFVKQVKKDEQGRTQLGVSSRAGLLVLVSVPGNVKKTGAIESFSYPKLIWQGPSNFDMRVKNSGTVHYYSTAKIEFQPMLGKTQIAELGTHTILPGNVRKYDGSWMNKYPFGYYRIKATATDGNGEEMIVEGGLWAIPLVIIIPVLVGAILLWVLLHYVKSNFQLVKKDR